MKYRLSFGRWLTEYGIALPSALVGGTLGPTSSTHLLNIAAIGPIYPEGSSAPRRGRTPGLPAHLARARFCCAVRPHRAHRLSGGRQPAPGSALSAIDRPSPPSRKSSAG